MEDFDFGDSVGCANDHFQDSSSTNRGVKPSDRAWERHRIDMSSSESELTFSSRTMLDQGPKEVVARKNSMESEAKEKRRLQNRKAARNYRAKRALLINHVDQMTLEARRLKDINLELRRRLVDHTRT